MAVRNHFRILPAFVPLFLFFFGAQPAAAQSQRFAALRDSLAQFPDSALGPVEARANALRVRTADTTAQTADLMIERGLVLLRLANADPGDDRVKEAVQVLTRAVALDPGSPWSHFALALAQLSSPEVRIGGGIFSKLTVAQVAAEIMGDDPRSKARRELKRVLEIDPAFEEAGIELAHIALDSRREEDLDAARTALVNSLDRGGADVALLLADVAVAMRDLPLAEVASNALAGSAADSSIALEVIGGIFMRIPGQEARGTAAYMAGIDRLTPAGAERYHNDIAMLATDLERTHWLDALESKDMEARRAWIRDFWSVRAARSAIRVQDRIVEHYRRLDVVFSKYRRSQRRGTPQAGSVLLEHERERLPFDDRGIVYLRYGKPDQVIRTTARGLYPNETWVYNEVEGERKFFHFVASRGAIDFSLVDNILAAAEDLAPTDAVIALLQDRAKIDPRYPIFAARLESMGVVAARDRLMPELRGTGSNDQLTSIQLENNIISGQHRIDVLKSLRRDDAEPHFESDIPFYYDLFGFKGASGRTELTAAIAIPGNFISGREVDGRIVYGIDVSVIVIDTLDSHVQRTDTTLRFWSSRRLGARDNIRFHVKLNAMPSTSTIHRIALHNIYAPSAGTVYRGSQQVPDFNGSGLLMSEIVLADSTSTGPWHRDVVQLSLLPPRQVTTDHMFSLFYELYNLPNGDPYRTELVIEPTDGSKLGRKLKQLFGGDGGVTKLSFEERASSNLAGTEQQLRRLRADLKPGRYKITVTVTNLRTFEKTTRDRMFVVREDKREDKA